jgi:hypothetical protein
MCHWSRPAAPSLDFASFLYFAALRETVLSGARLTHGFTDFRRDALKASAGIQKEDCQKRSERVKAAVLDGSGPAWDETLVVFIRQRKQTGDDYGGKGATFMPAFRIAGIEREVEKKAQNCIFGQMRELPNQEMDDHERGVREVNMQ